MGDEQLARLEERVERARGAIREPDWTDARARRAQLATARRLESRTRARAAAVGAALAIAAAVVLWILARPSAGPVAVPAPSPSVVAPSPVRPPAALPAGTLVLADGSRAEPRSAATDLRLIEDGAPLSRVGLGRGAASFRVTKNGARTFRVEVGAIRVEVLGTVFVVDRRDDGAVHVEVSEGRVRVAGGDHERELGAGEDDLFFERPSVDDAGAPPPTGSAKPGPDWRVLAKGGDYEAAYNIVVGQGGTTAVRDEANELLLAADVARLSGHPKQAVAPLRRILSSHKSDPRAVLAAFTLGRVLLDDLGQPREAAAAFATAQSLDPAGSLADDALVREVEAWARAGDAARANERARVYLQRHPEGARARQVKKLANIE